MIVAYDENWLTKVESRARELAPDFDRLSITARHDVMSRARMQLLEEKAAAAYGRAYQPHVAAELPSPPPQKPLLAQVAALFRRWGS